MNRTLNRETVQKIGEEVEVRGWVQTRRNMGKVVFLDMRDRTGLLQAVCVPAALTEESKQLLDDIRSEYVLTLRGMVVQRGAKQINEKLETGTVEMQVNMITLLNKALTPPFEIDKDTRTVNEETRLKYRYLDLRTERMRNNIRMRHKTMQFVRTYLSEQGFTEVHTPILSKSTPEGARDYLVPSRIHPGKFFALPQSPQQYKQPLMVAGLERYFQIAPCFRDEDARADRSPGEFYQIDVELSFVTQEEILALIETMFTALVYELFPEKHIMQEPWPRLTHAEAMKNYGNDKPDLRKDKNDPHELAFAWVLDFPLFTEQTEADFFHGAGEKWGPSHHMFTAPRPEDIHLLDTDPGKVRALQHDLVLNGFEVGGGSIRIHDAKLQEKIFDLIGFTAEQKQQFEHLLRAFEYGVPPHGGIAPGLDRFLGVVLGEKNIREVIAFPLMGDARDPLMGAPSTVAQKQLDEVHLQIKK